MNQPLQPSIPLATSLDDRLVSREAAEALWQRVRSLAKGGGRTAFSLESYWNGEMRWARNRVYVASDRRNVWLTLKRNIRGVSGRGGTDQLDDASIERAIRDAEKYANRVNSRGPLDMPIPYPPQSTPLPAIWSEATYGATAAMRGQLAKTLSQQADAKGLLAAGFLEVRGVTRAWAGGEAASAHEGASWREEGYNIEVDDVLAFTRMTQMQCSMTVRHPKGTGSGWAGLSSYDWNQVDCAALAERALEKCTASLNPVRIEPGRYTVILEPQAVEALLSIMMTGYGLSRRAAEKGDGPWVLDLDPALGIVRSKLGLKVVDERITLSSDPMDPLLGEPPFPGLAPITYIKSGVLTTLSYDRGYAVKELKEGFPMYSRMAIRMSGGTTTMDEMIDTTKRGLIVTRFSSLDLLDSNIPLATGVTRDGLWLVENGKITKAVKNMRITESPIFIFNQIDQLGIPVPVFRPILSWEKSSLSPSVVPPIKARDFSFISTVDAI